MHRKSPLNFLLSETSDDCKRSCVLNHLDGGESSPKRRRAITFCEELFCYKLGRRASILVPYPLSKTRSSLSTMDSPTHRRLSHDDYTVACICPMGMELAAVEGMLDNFHQSLPCSRDQNSYTLGQIGAHNIVVAVMPEIGTNRAAMVATQLLNDFRSIRFGLLVGIGAGVPSDEEDIRLGDVVVSKPTATFGGVVQFDIGKATVGTAFERTGTLKKPPAVLMANVERLRSQQIRNGNRIPHHLAEMLDKYPNMRQRGYQYQGTNLDQLFEATYPHQGSGTCTGCNRARLLKRDSRDDLTPKIHYGTIGSSNTLIKDGVVREELRKDLNIICVEMEAAGLMDEFSCLVIRGICDYADSHKNKRWQPYAAATAAAYMKEILCIIQPQEVKEIPRALDKMSE